MANSSIILYVAVFVGGLVFIGLAISQYRKAKIAETTWPTSPGVVLNAGVRAHRSRNSKGRTTVNYEPQVTYRYQVMGQTLDGDRLGFGSRRYSEGKANKIVAIYPPGTQVTVHYSPDDPSKAVLETKATSAGSYLTIGIILIILGVISVVILPS